MKIFAIAAVLLLSLDVISASTSKACGIEYDWKNENRTCPSSNSVCAEVTEMKRNLYNGTMCDEKRIKHQCMCPGNQLCPTSNPDFKLHKSQNDTFYMCQTVCSLPWCPKSKNLYPMIIVHNGPSDFGRRTYKKIECRCPRHHSPYTGLEVHYSTRKVKYRWKAKLQSYVELHNCNGQTGSMGDPCVSEEINARN